MSSRINDLFEGINDLMSASASQPQDYAQDFFLTILFGGILLIGLIILVIISTPALKEYNFEKEWIRRHFLDQAQDKH
ncbi:MAG: hypothetical protein ACFFCQ_02110 [Promethearchaeota archaeon]